jgi:hypothetical protein
MSHAARIIYSTSLVSSSSPVSPMVSPAARGVVVMMMVVVMMVSLLMVRCHPVVAASTVYADVRGRRRRLSRSGSCGPVQQLARRKLTILNTFREIFTLK